MRLGQDVEVFLQDQAGKHISAIGFINAGKEDPFQIPDMAPGFTLQEDNVSLEYGMPPAASMEEWDRQIEAVMEKSKEFVQGLSFSRLSCAVFDQDQMMHPRAHIFGCQPDHDAWTGQCNPKPNPPHPFMRSAGGHIHIETKEDHIQVIRAMDLFLGVPSVLMDQGEERKQLYGKAGAHRKKPYGVEYRTLSNFWCFDQALRQWVWRNVELGLSQLGLADQYQTEILMAINENDKSVAEFLVEKCGLEVIYAV